MSQVNKKDNKKFLSLPITYEQEESDSEGLLKLKLYFITVGQNPNKTNFSKSPIDNAVSSLNNKPILAYIQNKDTTQEDFKAHEIEFKEDIDGNVEVVYLEQPIGTIPENNNFHYEELNGLTYGVCDAYVWEDYCTNAGDILKENTSQHLSMEIAVQETVENEGITDITKFTYSGITMLSNKIGTGIEGAHAEVVNFALDVKEEFFDRVKDLNESLKIKFSKAESEINKKEESIMSKIKTKKEIATNYSLTMEQLEDELGRLICQVTYAGTDWMENDCQCCKYCLMDYDLSTAYAFDCEQGIYVGIPYKQTGDDIVLDYESVSRVKFSPTAWEGITPVENDADDTSDIDAMGNMEMALKETYTAKFAKILETKISEAVTAKEVELNAKFEAIPAKVETVIEPKIVVEPVKNDEKLIADKAEFEAKLTEKDTEIVDITAKFDKSVVDLNKVTEDFTAINLEVEGLKAFKLQKETEAKELKFAEYAEELTEEEVKSVRDKIAKFSIEEVETKLQLIFAKKNHKSTKNSLPKYNNMGLDKTNFSKKEDKAEPEISAWDKLENIKNK